MRAAGFAAMALLTLGGSAFARPPGWYPPGSPYLNAYIGNRPVVTFGGFSFPPTYAAPAWGSPMIYSPPVFYPPFVYDPPMIPSFPPGLLQRLQQMVPGNDAPPPDGNKAPAPVVKLKDPLEQKADMQKLIQQGSNAFGGGDYVNAQRLYERATQAAPLEASGYFHQAQAFVALGKYAEAIVAIQRGLRMQPNWSTAPFQPRLLYRDRASEFEDHLAKLADVVGKHMNDDSLLFLLGYELWFDGRKDEAKVLLHRAAALAMDPTFVDRFLKPPKVAAIPVANQQKNVE